MLTKLTPVATLSVRQGFNPGVVNLRSAWTFDMARIRIFVTQFVVQDRVKTKLHDKQVLKIVCHKKPLFLVVK